MQKKIDKLEVLELNCPVCNSTNKTSLCKYNSDDSLKHLSISSTASGYVFIKNQIIENWKGDICDFVECNNCSFNYAIPFVAGSKELYSLFYNASEIKPTINWEHITAKNLIIKKFGSSGFENKKLLEFGAGDGAFVNYICKNGFSLKNIVCTEASQSCRVALNGSGIKCLSNELALLNAPEFKNRFNIIALFQVLEHLDKIDEIFTTINFIASKNSSLFIAVPNNFMRRYYEKNGIFLDVPPIHISRWNMKSFALIGKKYGWEIKDYEIEKITFFACGYKFIWNKNLNKSVGRIKKRYMRKPLIALLVIPLFIAHLPKIIKISSSRNGTSQLVHLEKID